MTFLHTQIIYMENENNLDPAIWGSGSNHATTTQDFLQGENNSLGLIFAGQSSWNSNHLAGWLRAQKTLPRWMSELSHSPGILNTLRAAKRSFCEHFLTHSGQCQTVLQCFPSPPGTFHSWTYRLSLENSNLSDQWGHSCMNKHQLPQLLVKH